MNRNVCVCSSSSSSSFKILSIHKNLHLINNNTGFSFSGKPGLVVCEGLVQDVQEYYLRIRVCNYVIMIYVLLLCAYVCVYVCMYIVYPPLLLFTIY